MASVYLARDLRHERKVTLKALKPEPAAAVGAERFLAEIQTTLFFGSRRWMPGRAAAVLGAAGALATTLLPARRAGRTDPGLHIWRPRAEYVDSRDNAGGSARGRVRVPGATGVRPNRPTRGGSMRVLVAGATGVVGREVCRLLAEHGHDVRGLVRATSDAETRSWLEAAGVELVEGDLTKPETLGPACAGVDAVISTASAIGSQQPGDSLDAVDRDGQAALVDAAVAAGATRYVFVSVLGIGPDSPFARGKQSTEAKVRASGLHYTIVRPSVFMDTWLTPHVGFDWATGTVTIYGDGERPQAWIHSSDVAAAVVEALESDEALNAEVKVVGPEALTPNQVVALFEDVLGRSLEKAYVPVDALEAQRAGAQHPLEQSFAALMLRYASGDPEHAAMPSVGTCRVTVRDYARSVTS